MNSYYIFCESLKYPNWISRQLWISDIRLVVSDSDSVSGKPCPGGKVERSAGEVAMWQDISLGFVGSENHRVL